MKLHSIAMMLAVLFTVGTAAGEATAPTRETRAVWLWPNTVRDQGAEKIAAKLAENHINVVLLLVKGEAGSAAWDSKVSIAKGPSDVLKAMSDACQARNIELHAWVIFTGDRAWVEKHPDDGYMRVGSKDNPDIHRPAGGHRVCPLSDEYRAYFLARIRELISRPETYKLAGIHLDVIRYPHMSYCFCPRHQAKAKELGIDLDHVRDVIKKTLYGGDKNLYFNLVKSGTDPDINKWVALRENDIESMVKQVRETMDQVDPKLQLSAAFMPEGGEKDDTFAIAHYAQNYRTLGAYMDFICPMTYHRSFKKPVSWPTDIAVNAHKKSGTTVLAGFADPEDADIIIAAQRQNGIPGFVFFQYTRLEPVGWEKIRSVVTGPAAPRHELSAPIRTRK
jgi:uncharacterized lipoprotein YddW (UPF0748 family)